jgi:hypothetical protein
MHNFMRAAAVLTARTVPALVVAGCATAIHGSSQNVTVITEPPGATCVFRRDGQVIGVVNPTPGTLSVTKSHVGIEVACTKQGHAAAQGSIGAKFLPTTLGNVLLGGLVGVAIDATSGANNEYEPDIRITLAPLHFATVAERDAFFVERRATFLAQSKSAKNRIVSQCQGGGCQRQLDAAEAEEKAGLARIEVEQESARAGS